VFSFGERQATFFFSGHFGLNDFLAFFIGTDIHRQFCFAGIGGNELYFSFYSFLTTSYARVFCKFYHFGFSGQASLSEAGRARPQRLKSGALAGRQG